MMRKWQGCGFVGPVTACVAMLAVAFLVAPLVAICLISFSSSRYLEFPPPAYSLRWYRALTADSSWAAATLLSAEVALLVAVVATAVALSAALALRGQSPSRVQRGLLALAVSPLVAPGIVFAVGWFFLAAHIGILETRAALVLSHTALAMPVALLTILASLQAMDRRLEPAARTLGATWIEATWRVTIPVAGRGLAAAFIFAFATSFDEPVVALFVTGTHAITLPKRMWDGVQYEIDPTAAAVSALLVACSSVLIIIASQLASLRNRSRAGGQDLNGT
jgi:putative spermidine/putrescine transport system permease protein